MKHRNCFALMVLLQIALGLTASAEAAESYKYILSSGLFGLPANAASVDWAITNNSNTTQSYRITVYKGKPNLLKTAVAPGPLAATLNSGMVTHNANSVGAKAPFVPGFYYEVVLETNSLAMMPTVSVWSDQSGTVIPGTTILPRDFSAIR